MSNPSIKGNSGYANRRFGSLNRVLTVLLFCSVASFGCDALGLSDDDGDDDGTPNISDVAGDWIRVESNNPSNDFMKVRVTGSAGTITDRAGSGFSNGAVKWSAITPGASGIFNYSELGSDNNYYDATMTMVNANELEIAVGHTGAGNTQKWLRDDGSIVDTTATELACDISDDTTLTKKAGDVDYFVPSNCVVDITATLTINPGVVIAFEANSGLGVYDTGSLNAVGTASEPIILRGTNNVRGYWRGIHTESDAVLKHVQIKNAGSNYVYCCNDKAALFAKRGRLTLENSTITQSGEFGLVMRNDLDLVSFVANTITDNAMAPVSTTFEVAAGMDGAGSSYAGNDEDYIEIAETTVNQATTIAANDVPYLVEGNVVDVTEAMTVQEGVEIAFEENGGIGVYDNGSLSLDGTAANPVKLYGKSNVRGYWRGIHLETNSLNNRFSYAMISDAGANYVYCCNIVASVFVKDGRFSIANSEISNGEEYGLYASKDAQLTYAANTIETHGNMPLYLAAERAGELDGAGSTYTNNDVNYVGIYNSDISEAVTWPANSVPYLVEGGVVVDVKEGLTIAEGAEIVFRENAGLGVYDNGYLKAVGTSSAQIAFRGLENLQGYWRGIHTETNSLNNIISHAVIQNAGSNYVYCCNEKAGLLVKAGTMEVENSFISDNAGCGIFVRPGATLSESGNTFSSNEDGHICN